MQYKVFGCKVNKYYTDKWLNSKYLRDKSGTFVASCVVTDSAKRKWVRFVKKELEILSENDKIYISWCGAFKDGKAQGDFFILYPELAFAQEQIEILDEAPEEIADEVKIEVKKIHKEKEEETNKGAINLSKLDKLKAFKNTQIYTKKFILIQGWCDSFCSFCLTVQKRGRHYYRAAEDIAEEIRDFETDEGKEVVLTGVNLSAWGLKNTHNIQDFAPEIEKSWVHGTGSRFAELLRYLLENTNIPRLRISSLGPEFIDEEVLEVFKNTRIYPHFHYSVQSGSSSVLKSMARHYNGDFMKDLLLRTKNIKRDDGVDISLGADIIVWFPWETEEDFMDTYNLVKDCGITKVHAFPFSPHTLWESVPAGKFKNQISDSIKKERMNRITEVSDTIREDFKRSQKWKTLHVLIEKAAPPSWSGWSENYLEADETNFEVIDGTIWKNKIVTGRFI